MLIDHKGQLLAVPATINVGILIACVIVFAWRSARTDIQRLIHAFV
jgi:hypothetical protein